jgi:hypothetical protein
MKMKITVGFVFAFLLCLLSASNVEAQGCGGVFTPHFSVYMNQTMDGSNNISQQVEIDGYTEIHPSNYCRMSYATHTPRVTNLLGSTGGTQSGPSTCPTCYSSFSTTQVIVGIPGVLYMSDGDAAMVCSVAGTFFDGGGNSKTEIALVRVHTKDYTCGMVGGVEVCNVTSFEAFCTPETTPPDYLPHGLVTTDNPPIPYYDMKTTCYTYSTQAPYSWTCFPTAQGNIKPVVATPESGDCTKYPHAGGSNITVH